MIISFGWTSDALIAGAKDTTRRDWSQPWFERMQALGHYTAGDVVDAWDALPRVKSKNPAHIARIQILTDVKASRDLPEGDYEREGFAWLQRYGYTLNGKTPETLWRNWADAFDPYRKVDAERNSPPVYVVRFKVVRLTPAGLKRWSELHEMGREMLAL